MQGDLPRTLRGELTASQLASKHGVHQAMIGDWKRQVMEGLVSVFSDIASVDTIRTLFSRAMSNMYHDEVPQYGTLMRLVHEVNDGCRHADPALDQRLAANGDHERLALERHGAIRVGTARELGTMRRLFAVMGMQPVSYYDLSVASVPVHSTAFRPLKGLHRRQGGS